MPRCFDDDVNELTLFDNLSNSKIVMYYRDPTPEERVAYANESVSRKRNKVVMRVSETRLKYGLLIMTGFREGDILVKESGVKVPISSDPSSPNYRPGWKDLWKQKAADLIMQLAMIVFDGSSELEEADTTPDTGDAPGIQPADEVG